MIQLIAEALEKEEKWHLENAARYAFLGPDWQKGFIEGMKHVRLNVIPLITLPEPEPEVLPADLTEETILMALESQFSKKLTVEELRVILKSNSAAVKAETFKAFLGAVKNAIK